jgi:hypothetical protein
MNLTTFSSIKNTHFYSFACALRDFKLSQFLTATVVKLFLTRAAMNDNEFNACHRLVKLVLLTKVKRARLNTE